MRVKPYSAFTLGIVGFLLYHSKMYKSKCRRVEMALKTFFAYWVAIFLHKSVRNFYCHHLFSKKDARAFGCLKLKNQLNLKFILWKCRIIKNNRVQKWAIQCIKN